MSDVAVVIGAYQSAHLLPDCLDSLDRQTRRPVEVVVVDPGSTDGTSDVARAHGARVLTCANNGLGYLYNRGAEAVTTDFVLVANADLAFDERCVEDLARALAADSMRFAADPRQVEWEDGRAVHRRSVLSRGTLRDPIPWHRLDANVAAASTVWTVYANAGAMLLRRDALLELGGFDETFFLDYEDLDLCWRAWLRGWESVYVPEACVRHRVGASMTGAVPARRLVGSHHNVLRFALKCLPPGAAAAVVAGELARLVSHPRVAGAALLRVAGELPEIVRLRRRIRPTRDVYRRLLA